jgi:melibiose permease/lactose/raffinose/galactose permease
LTPTDVTAEGLLLLKLAMMVLPLLCILVGYIIYRRKYIIDKDMYEKIIKDLKAQGQMV